jgi:hypothetical protein
MDYRLAGHPRDRIKEFVAFMGMSDADFEQAWAMEPKTAMAEQRAVIGGLTYEQFKRLDIHRSGCAEKTAAERRRITLDNQNTKKRARRAARAAAWVNFQTALERVKFITQERIQSVKRFWRCSMATVKSQSLGKVVGSMLESEIQGESTGRILESASRTSKTLKMDAKKPAAPPELCPESVQGDRVPFGERVQLIMQHLGWPRRAAVLEALRWLT